MSKTPVILFTTALMLSSCANLPKDEEREYFDNYTYIENNNTETYTEIIRDNVTSLTEVTTVSTIIEQQTQDNQTIPYDVPEEFTISVLGGLVKEVPFIDWDNNTISDLTIHVSNSPDGVVLNQTGVQPELDQFPNTDNGFVFYSLDKQYMSVAGALVDPDNTSKITIIYETQIHALLKKEDIIYTAQPFTYTVKVLPQ